LDVPLFTIIVVLQEAAALAEAEGEAVIRADVIILKGILLKTRININSRRISNSIILSKHTPIASAIIISEGGRIIVRNKKILPLINRQNRNFNLHDNIIARLRVKLKVKVKVKVKTRPNATIRIREVNEQLKFIGLYLHKTQQFMNQALRRLLSTTHKCLTFQVAV
jgi:hypothetical protein